MALRRRGARQVKCVRVRRLFLGCVDWNP
jgi:hypothetical protein